MSGQRLVVVFCSPTFLNGMMVMPLTLEYHTIHVPCYLSHLFNKLFSQSELCGCSFSIFIFVTLQRFEVYGSKMSSQDSYMEGPNCDLKNSSDSREKKSHHQLKRKVTSYNYSSSIPGGKSALDKYGDLAAETSSHSSKRNYKLSSMHGVEGTRPDTVSNHHHPDGTKAISEQADPWLHDYDNSSPNIVQKKDYKSKPSNLIPGFSKSLDTQERVLSTMSEKVFYC